MTSNIKGHIYGLIDEIKAAEKITKAKLSILSRDILSYVMDTDDIAAVNRLLGVLTPVNKRVATLFFQHFMPWEQEKNADDVFQRFGKKLKADKKIKTKQDLITQFLADESNNIWTWAETNVEVEAKKKDFAGMITRTITQALKGDEKSDTPPIDPLQALDAVFAAGVDIEHMLAAIEAQEKRKSAEADLAAAMEKAMANGVGVDDVANQVAA